MSAQHLRHSQHWQQQQQASKVHNPQQISAASLSSSPPFPLLPVFIWSGAGWNGGWIVNKLFGSAASELELKLELKLKRKKKALNFYQSFSTHTQL